MAQRDILIVDDDRQVRDVLHQIFLSAGYNCLLANDGREGLEVFRAARPPLQMFPYGHCHIGQVRNAKPQFLKNLGWNIDGEIVAGQEYRGRYQGHYGNKAFGEHSAVADKPQVPLTRYHLRGGAGTYKAVEARNSAAGDGDADIRPDMARYYGASAVNKAGKCRRGDFRPYP